MAITYQEIIAETRELSRAVGEVVEASGLTAKNYGLDYFRYQFNQLPMYRSYRRVVEEEFYEIGSSFTKLKRDRRLRTRLYLEEQPPCEAGSLTTFIFLGPGENQKKEGFRVAGLVPMGDLSHQKLAELLAHGMSLEQKENKNGSVDVILANGMKIRCDSESTWMKAIEWDFPSSE